MRLTPSDDIASVIILAAAAAVLLGTVSAYAVSTGFNGRANEANEAASGGFSTRSQDYWAAKRAAGILGGGSGSGGTASMSCGCQNNAGRMSGPV